ncbi:glycoside hydrolase family 9 protein [Gilvimarinus sp. SDUM040013]|uniref:Glycoside hydrolase family 9 protein n=1 Tax=Gilvimarinus gilvus TaxID=3058038 RepID=A0ABU4RYG0_9GAMM|nr:glycoside hydrolase family 9 protein [Gilvimarinus sp. SDUM040013]MDO3385611.1 glycoside hydrolase family 9 protein [Gilvimarinus sp. SDUM040013]MDX6849945.1 glycoside hydrolase family 9 protein [Gilvimarinus sp. SDUM040013]
MHQRFSWRPIAAAIACSTILSACTTYSQTDSPSALTLNTKEYFESDAVDVLAFSSKPGGLFFDSKTAGIEIIHHGERTATNGDVRLLHTPEQWDGMGQFVSREVNQETGTITTQLAYPELDFSYAVKATVEDKHLVVSVHLDRPLPAELVGKAGFNMEFVPAEYWDKSYLADGKPGQFPRSASTPYGMITNEQGLTEPTAFASANSFVFAPGDPERRVTITETLGDGELMLFDGRTKAQNGWYVVRDMIPAEKTGKVVEWTLDINAKPGWVREPVIGFSQVGYHPSQSKQAVIELDVNDAPESTVELLRINADGSSEQVLQSKPASWGSYLRYNYITFDFSGVTAPGLYQLRYGNQTTPAFPIDTDVLAKAWQPTLDFFFPVQMDHMLVREAYRVWHGRSHMDDALQAPPNYEHFDLYAHGENLDTEFKPFEHIDGLDYGGWYDAGDYDIRTQSQYHTVQGLVHAVEEFGIERDNTTVDQAKKFTQINRPDGKQDILQQIEHGTLALIAQHRAIGHAIPGIVAGRLYQYPHLGDGSTKTDNMVYDASMDPHASERGVGKMYEPSTVDPTAGEDLMPENGTHSGRFDDRWAFTTNSTALNYGSAAALAAASRVLGPINQDLADESLTTAKKVWEYEANREPNTYRFGNTTGGRLEEEKLKAAVELLITTKEDKYAHSINELLPEIEDNFRGENIAMLVGALPHMNDAYSDKLKALTVQYRKQVADIEKDNPYGVPITRGGWAGNGSVMSFGISNYWLNKAFPDIVEEELVYRSLNYIFGTHPDSNYSFASGIGAQSQTAAYGANRADFSYIPGGVVPGVLVLPPDLPENKSNWPFFWGQNEYVIPMGSRYLFLTHAAQTLLEK